MSQAQHSLATCCRITLRPHKLRLLLCFQDTGDDAHGTVIVPVGKEGQLRVNDIDSHVNRSNSGKIDVHHVVAGPVPVQRETMISYVRECIKLAHDLGSPICKIFAAWRGITLHDGLATYDETYGYNQYGFWKGDRRGFVVESMRELCRVAEDHGIVLAMQNHGPDIVNRYQDVLSLIEEVGSPVFKACMDINIEPEADSPEHARQMADASRSVQVHSHMNGEFARRPDGSVELVAAGYFDKGFWGRQVAYPAYVDALVANGYRGYMNWEFCHPGWQNGKPVGIDYVHNQTEMAFDYLSGLRAGAEQKLEAITTSSR